MIIINTNYPVGITCRCAVYKHFTHVISPALSVPTSIPTLPCSCHELLPALWTPGMVTICEPQQLTVLNRAWGPRCEMRTLDNVQRLWSPVGFKLNSLLLFFVGLWRLPRRQGSSESDISLLTTVAGLQHISVFRSSQILPSTLKSLGLAVLGLTGVRCCSGSIWIYIRSSGLTQLRYASPCAARLRLALCCFHINSVSITEVGKASEESWWWLLMKKYHSWENGPEAW